MNNTIQYKGYIGSVEFSEDDGYLETCKAEGKEPETAFKGSFNVRLSPDLHEKIFVYAVSHQMSMNKYIEDVLKNSPAAREIV